MAIRLLPLGALTFILKVFKLPIMFNEIEKNNLRISKKSSKRKYLYREKEKNRF